MENENKSFGQTKNSPNWFMRHKIITGILALVLLGVVVSAFNGGDKSTTNTKSNINTPTTNNAPVATAKTYQSVFTFNGSGAKKSEPFTITGDRFKIKYDCAGSLCQAFLYKVGSSIPTGVLMNKAGATKDETTQYGAGEYYIDANTIGDYTMTVEDYK